MKYLNSELSSPVGFPVNKRLSSFACCRFGNLDNVDSSYSYFPGKQDCLVFTVDKNILLLGITLCGSENNEYSVTIRIKKLDVSGVYLYSVSGKFPSLLIEEELHSFYGFKIFFGDPIFIKQGIKHRIEASTSGANSCFGRDGQKVVACSGINISLQTVLRTEMELELHKGNFQNSFFKRCNCCIFSIEHCPRLCAAVVS